MVADKTRVDGGGKATSFNNVKVVVSKKGAQHIKDHRISGKG